MIKEAQNSERRETKNTSLRTDQRGHTELRTHDHELELADDSLTKKKKKKKKKKKARQIGRTGAKESYLIESLPLKAKKIIRSSKKPTERRG